MFFLGGMTMGYLDPPVRADRKEQITVSMPAEQDRRLIGTETSDLQQDENAIERSWIWAWRTLC